ncbi:hypothetical protein NLU13_6719 [Sarocladium strictum]|uniref:Peptidase M3A/M3B catalytic domain-containing protein n=1 Tax=Sarocladium strictum TaxID=5046 RepID=A0AA39GFD5_SARSR|nr:hypothetical protein NLU13_6719 [Sarocladium strictum]
MMLSVPPQPPPQLPAIEDIVPQTQRLLDRYDAVCDSIVHSVTPETATFENVLKPLIVVENETNGGLGVIAMLQYASPIPEVRRASEEAVALMGSCSSARRERRDMYRLVQAVHDRGERLGTEAQKYLDTEFKEYRRFGHGILSPTQIQEYSQRRDEIDELRRKFNRNVREEDGGLWFDVNDLVGIPEESLVQFQQRKGETGNDQRFVRFGHNEMTIAMQYAAKASTRKKLFIAESFRLPQNDRIFKQIITLRDKNARMLGYANHAAFRLEKRVAKNVEWVEELLKNLEEALTPTAREETEQLCAIKWEYLRHQGQTLLHPALCEQDLSKERLDPWDVKFYSRIASEQLQVNRKKIAEYFPLNHVKPAMLDIFASFLQLKFIPAQPELICQSKWHDDVEAWGNQCVNLQSGYSKDDGTRVYPATILMCSFAKESHAPTPLLEHSQLVTMFHELGHGIHDLISRTSYTAFHGYRAPPDFAEAPSVMLENWCWLPDELKRLSCHYTTLDSPTPESIPDNMISNLIKSRSLNRGRWFLRQLALSRYDLAVHTPSDHQSCENMDLGAIFSQIYDPLSLDNHLSPEQRGYPHADFTHLVSGYDAGYYSYLAAHVFAADLFKTIFARDPRDLASWDNYRRGILEPGGSRDCLEMLTTFLGHAPDPSALLQGFEGGKEEENK